MLPESVLDQFRAAFWHSQDQNGSFWSEEVHVGPFRTANCTVATCHVPFRTEELVLEHKVAFDRGSARNRFAVANPLAIPRFGLPTKLQTLALS